MISQFLKTEEKFTINLEEIQNSLKNFFRHKFLKGQLLSWEECVGQFLIERDLPSSLETELLSVYTWYQEVRSFKSLFESVKNQQWEEYFSHGPSTCLLKTKMGLIPLAPLPLSDADFFLAMQILAFDHGLSWSEAKPFISFRSQIPGIQARLTLLHPCTGPAPRPQLFIRNLSHTHFPLTDFGIAPDLEAKLAIWVKEKKNILVCGATGSGKTSFSTSLLSYISPQEHVIILEDTHELVLSHPHTTYMLADQTHGKHLVDYCSYALRMAPDRLILGELRSHEVVPFVLAMNTGHNGLISTLHANSAQDGISRLALLFKIYSQISDVSFEDVVSLISKNIHFVLFLENKNLKEVIQIFGAEKGRPLFEYVFPC